ncbi:sulfatase family protein [Ruminiclostridium cellobioparum]|uniref:Arylsulfatase A n=1 Tax=Ruminiclostridium cellobioparum subsp. termitidis CT1112 TaxID=1195236 RepID=S0FSN9_RUMCE|nr:sulfatase-like hydrolase/transferase [Ruminiclostridium cellobioparum]EMS71543.1 arylsulfatase A [Ruminiclostridium cellobioparum subsp. termitidis CT1112]
MKNILFIMTDQHRYDHVGYSGCGKVDTPNIDRISQGTAFTRCNTVNPICQPARTALAAGRYPHQIGTLAMSGDFSLQIPTFMKALQKKGYQTEAVGKLHYLQTWHWGAQRGKVLDLTGLNGKIREYGYDYVWEAAGKQLMEKSYCDYSRYLEDRGLYEQYLDFAAASGPNYDTPDKRPQDNGEPFPLPEEHYPDIVIADRVIERIKNRPANKPLMMLCSFLCPHKPFDPPASYLDRQEYREEEDFIPGKKPLSEEDKKHLYRKRRAYRAMIHLIDDQVGRLFKVLEEEGILDETVIIFTSDHGEMMGDHFLIQKSVPYKEAVTVPTAVRHPDYLTGGVNSSPVELTDLTATILELAGLDPQKALGREWPAFNNIIPCRSLMPIIRGEAGQIREFAFTECSNEWQMIQTKDWKYIYYPARNMEDSPAELFFDSSKDPEELVNLAGRSEYQEAVEWCRSRRISVMDTTLAAQLTWAPLNLTE